MSHDRGAAEASKATSRAGNKSQQATLSFVQFDGSASSDAAAKKAVRKQAALSSAKQRKATIAAKIAKQKEEDDQRKREVTLEGVPERREGVKRKRSADNVGQAALWQAAVVDPSPWPVIRPANQSWTPSDRGTVTQMPSKKAAPFSNNWQTGLFFDPVPSRSDQTQSRIYAQEQVDPSNSTMPAHLSPSHPSMYQDQSSSNVGAFRPLSPPMEYFDEHISAGRALMPPATAVSILPHVDQGSHADRRDVLSEKPISWPFMALDFENNEAAHIEDQLPMTPESIASPPRSASIIDPFNQYPVKYFPIYDRLLHYMLTVFAPRGWSSLKITHDQGLAYEGFMTNQALAEPALWLVRLTFASGDLINRGVLDWRVAIALKTLAIKSINDALSDAKRCTSDGLILAVGRIALTETLYGDKSAASTHRSAQRRMIDLRGGIGTLGFPPLITRLMRWSDRVMSIQTDTPRLLPDDEDQGNTTLTIDQSLDLIENWAPQTGSAMRRKIAIADLIE